MTDADRLRVLNRDVKLKYALELMPATIKQVKALKLLYCNYT